MSPSPKNRKSDSTLYGVGLGPGDPELVTRRAVRIIEMCDEIAYFSSKPGASRALRIVADLVRDKATIELQYPLTGHGVKATAGYGDIMGSFYDRAAQQLAERMTDGKTIALICEGEPMLFGSFVHIFYRLRNRFDVDITPGISSMTSVGAVTQVPLAMYDEALAIVPATRSEDDLMQSLAATDSAVMIKIGSNFPKLHRVLEKLSLLDRAIYVENSWCDDQVCVPLRELPRDHRAPYFSLIVIASRFELS